MLCRKLSLFHSCFFCHLASHGVDEKEEHDGDVVMMAMMTMVLWTVRDAGCRDYGGGAEDDEDVDAVEDGSEDDKDDKVHDEKIEQGDGDDGYGVDGHDDNDE